MSCRTSQVVTPKVRESRDAASQDQNEGGSVVIDVVPAGGVSGGLAVASFGSSAAACGPSTDFEDHGGVIDVDAVLDAASEVSVLWYDIGVAEETVAEFGTGDAQETCVNQASDTHPPETRQTSSTGRPRRVLPSRSFWRAPVEDVWATIRSLARHLTPHWLGYSLHMSRAQRFCLLVTSIVTSGSWQCLVSSTNRGLPSARVRVPSRTGTE